jgi:hypothetical protein
LPSARVATASIGRVGELIDCLEAGG